MTRGKGKSKENILEWHASVSVWCRTYHQVVLDIHRHCRREGQVADSHGDGGDPALDSYTEDVVHDEAAVAVEGIGSHGVRH